MTRFAKVWAVSAILWLLGCDIDVGCPPPYIVNGAICTCPPGACSVEDGGGIEAEGPRDAASGSAHVALDAGAPASGVQDIHLAAKWITDLEFRFKPMGDRLTLALGGNNIFDVYPTNTPRGQAVDPDSGLTVNLPSTRYVTPFSNFSPFGFNGRFLYGRVSVNF